MFGRELGGILPTRAMSIPDRFHPFSTLHAICVGLCLLAIAGACVIGWRYPRRERSFARAWAWSIVVSQVLFNIWWLWPDGAYEERDIPLNMCRLAVVPAALALLLPDPPHRWPRALLYFWGLGLCTQALVTPVFPEGPTHAAFWVFWIGHLQIVGSAVYDVVVRRFRPTGRDFLIGAGLGVVYAVAMFFINWRFKTNYGGLGPTVFDAPNMARALGPWPLRPLSIVLIAIAWMALLWRIWAMSARLRRLVTSPPRAVP